MSIETQEITVNGATRKQLLSLPHRDWDDDSAEYDSLMVLADGKKHGSGWGLIVIIGCVKQRPVEIAACCADDINWQFEHSPRMDCALPSRAMHFWTRKGKFRVGPAFGSTDVWLVSERDQ